MYKRKKSH